jgi:hypothetical protein
VYGKRTLATKEARSKFPSERAVVGAAVARRAEL